jgi:hypothetical protein
MDILSIVKELGNRDLSVKFYKSKYSKFIDVTIEGRLILYTHCESKAVHHPNEVDTADKDAYLLIDRGNDVGGCLKYRLYGISFKVFESDVKDENIKSVLCQALSTICKKIRTFHYVFPQANENRKLGKTPKTSRRQIKKKLELAKINSNCLDKNEKNL